jgi:hypothetical protein
LNNCDALFPDLLDNVEGALAEGLPDGIEEDKDDVAQLGQPQYCFIHIEGIAERDFKARGYKEMSSTLAETNSALVYEPKCGGRRRNSGVSGNEYRYNCTKEFK